MTDLEYGILSGPAFLIPFGIAHLLIGRYTDSLRRPELVLLISSILANVSLAFEAAATSFWTLLYPRILFSIFSAGVNNTGYYLIGHYFKQNQRAFAMAIYNMSIFAGSALSSISLLLI
jgi:predicted MFS family arabinose efflux permease